MTEKKNEITCELCKEEPATILCSECSKRYCDECSEFIHRKGSNKGHTTKLIPKGITIKATCPFHTNAVLEMFCVDEKKLCCFGCVVDNLHKGHKVVKIAEIAQDNETFSAADARKDFETILNRAGTLKNKITGVIEGIADEKQESKGKIEETFKEAHKKLTDKETKLNNDIEQELEKLNEKRTKVMKELETEPKKPAEEEAKVKRELEQEFEKLNDKRSNAAKELGTEHEKLKEEEKRIMKELDDKCIETEKSLGNDLSILKEVQEYGSLLIDAGKVSDNCNRLMELNIVSEMEEQRGKIGKLLRAEMRDLRIRWDREARKLSFTRRLFNGVPSVKDVSVKTMSWSEVEVSWEINDEDKGDDEIWYAVETRREGEKEWEVVKNLLTDKKCRVNGLTEDSVYDVRVRCVAAGGSITGEWCDAVKGKTQKIPVPSDVTVKDITWDTAILAWNSVEGATSYQVEMDGGKSLETSTTNTLTKGGLSPGTEHSFRVRTVRGSSASEWSGVVKGKTQKIPVPSGVAVKNVTCSSISITWDGTNNYCGYEIELESMSSLKSIQHSEKPEYTFYDLKPGTEYRIRVCTVVLHKDTKCMWSDTITVQTKNFSGCVWKVCPANVYEDRKYSIGGENPRVATKVNDSYYCTIIGNTPIPLNKVTSWSIKILKSRDSGYEIYVGVAPNDINQNIDYNFNKCGWYFYCYYSSLYSGPPHNYRDKEYGPRKERRGQYVFTGSSIGVVIDMENRELSFTLNNVNYGVAYCGIPLDKPLVPCVILRYKGDSVELYNLKLR